MYVLAYIGSGLLLRYAEGATFLAIVQVSNFKHFMCTTFAKKNYTFIHCKKSYYIVTPSYYIVTPNLCMMVSTHICMQHAMITVSIVYK